MDYEKIFQESYLEWVEREGEDGNGYKELCMAVEAAFRAAGFDIPGDSLHRKYHNYIVGSVRNFKTLQDVAKSFLGWIWEPTDANRGHQMSQIAKGQFPAWMFGRGPEISSAYVQAEIERKLKGNPETGEKRIMRGSKRYKALIEEKAKTVIEYMVEQAKEAIEEYKAKAIVEAKAIDRENQAGYGYMCALLELVEMVKTFRVIGGVEDYRPEIEDFLMREYEVIRKGYEARVKELDKILNREHDPLAVVERACWSGDLKEFWAAYKRQSE